MLRLEVVCVGCRGMVRSALAMQFVFCCSRLAAHTLNMTGKGMCAWCVLFAALLRLAAEDTRF